MPSMLYDAASTALVSLSFSARVLSPCYNGHTAYDPMMTHSPNTALHSHALHCVPAARLVCIGGGQLAGGTVPTVQFCDTASNTVSSDCGCFVAV